jgi:hypothetical protein
LFQFISDNTVNVPHFCIYGDFNLPDIDWDVLTSHTQISADFLRLCFQIGASQCVKSPKRENNILDLVLCSDSNLIQELSCEVPFSDSDHACIVYSMQPFSVEKKPRVMKPCFAKADYTMINAYLSTLDWDVIYENCTSASDYFAAFKTVIDYVIAKFVPFEESRSPKKIPWFNESLKRLRKVKQRKWQRYRSNKNVVRYAQYNASAKLYKQEFLKSKCLFEQKLFDVKNSNPKKFYNYIRKQNTVCSLIPCMKKTDNSLATSDTEKAELFSEYFSSVFVHDNGVLPDCDINHTTSFDMFHCDVKPMIKIVKKLKSNASPGPDKVTPLFLKNIIANIAKPLCNVYNKCLDEGFVPADWKVAQIIPIFKKGDTQSPGNYRPVSLTSVLCKVLEKVVREQMLKYLFDNGIIPKNQHGFLPKRSTTTNLLECLDDWTSNFDKVFKLMLFTWTTQSVLIRLYIPNSCTS